MSADLDVPFNKCSFLTAHNAFVNREEGWVWYQHASSIDSQLRAGLRAFMIDIWLDTVKGTRDVYLLHGGWKLEWLFPDFRFRTLDDVLQQFAQFLRQSGNENEIVTIIIETGESTKTSEGVTLVKQAIGRYSDLLFDPTAPAFRGFETTLREMVKADKRLVILSDYRGRDTHSEQPTDRFGLPSLWHYARETTYGSASLDFATWVDLRPESKDSKSSEISLNILNHFPTWVIGQYFIEDNEERFEDFLHRYFTRTNGLDRLQSHIVNYKMKHKDVPNFVAIDMLGIGAGAQAVLYCDELRKQGSEFIVQILGVNGHYMTAPDGIKNDSLIYCRKGTPLRFEVHGTFDHCVMRLHDNGTNTPLYLNYRNLTGAVKLYSDSSDAHFVLKPIGNETYKIYSIDQKQYMWLSGDEPYITAAGEAAAGPNYWMLNVNGAAPSPKQVEIRSLDPLNPDFLVASSGLNDNSLIYCHYNRPLAFSVIGPDSDCILRLVGHMLYLNFRDLTGAVKLYSDAGGATFTVKSLGKGAFSIYSVSRRQYMWVDASGEPYITSKGDPTKENARWEVTDPAERTEMFTLVKIISAKNDQPMRVKKFGNDQLIYCRHGYGPIVEFVQVGSDSGHLLVVCDYPLYLNYRDLTGAVKLYSGLASFERKARDDNRYLIYNEEREQYMWLSGDEPYITESGRPEDLSAQWRLESREV